MAVSFGTNNNVYEPAQGFKILQQFRRRGASIQSWYWWERHGKKPKAELDMPPHLMAQHTNDALASGCEVIQFEPFWYFFNNDAPKTTIAMMFAQIRNGN